MNRRFRFGMQATALVVGAALCFSACGSDGGDAADADAGANGDEVSAAAVEFLSEEIRDRGYVSVATTFGFPPSQFKNENNEPDGSTVDISDALGRKLGLEFRQVEAPFDAIIAGLEAGRYDVTVGAMNITDERKEVLNFVEYMSSATVVAINSESKSEISDWTDLCGQKVGQVKGSVQIDEVTEASAEHCESQGSEAIEIVTFNGSDDVYQAVVTGRIDGSLRSYSSQVYAVENSEGKMTLADDTFSHKGMLGIATAAENTDLAQAIHVALQELMDDGEYVEILKKWGEEAVALEETKYLPVQS